MVPLRPLPRATSTASSTSSRSCRRGHDAKRSVREGRNSRNRLVRTQRRPHRSPCCTADKYLDSEPQSGALRGRWLRVSRSSPVGPARPRRSDAVGLGNASHVLHPIRLTTRTQRRNLNLDLDLEATINRGLNARDDRERLTYPAFRDTQVTLNMCATASGHDGDGAAIMCSRPTLLCRIAGGKLRAA